MPTYEYECTDCGDFTAARPMAEYREPQPCPDCGTVSPRVLRSAPAYSSVSTAVRTAHGVNERSAHAPQTSAEMKAKHGAGCGCCSGIGKSRAVQSADGKKAFPDKRPWMISH